MKSNNDLLIRIDERQKEMSKDISSIKDGLDHKVDNDIAHEKRVKRIDTLWDDRNKLVGYMLGAGVAGGGTVSLLAGAIKFVWARF